MFVSGLLSFLLRRSMARRSRRDRRRPSAAWVGASTVAMVVLPPVPWRGWLAEDIMVCCPACASAMRCAAARASDLSGVDRLDASCEVGCGMFGARWKMVRATSLRISSFISLNI